MGKQKLVFRHHASELFMMCAVHFLVPLDARACYQVLGVHEHCTFLHIKKQNGKQPDAYFTHTT